jgi:hypothetical protein
MSQSSENHRIGITPILLRRAAYYVTLGEGTYFPDHPHFDKVVVERLYDFKQNPLDPIEWSLGLTVAFFYKGRRVRWVEFGCRTIGAGGDDIMRVENPNE